MRAPYDFPGGIHPPEHKQGSTQQAIAQAPLPAHLIVSLKQSLGNPARACIPVGQRVLKGQCIAQADGLLSVNVHAPSSGTVIAIEALPYLHRSGLSAMAIVIATDGEEAWQPRQRPDWQHWRLDQASQYLREMGIVGQGGAIFPSALKLKSAPLEQLVINGAECEPFITCDDRLMQERASDIVQGISMVAHFMRPQQVLIGIEDNKPAAIAAMQAACAATPFQVVSLPTKYPSGSAKQLIRLLTGKAIPHGTRSTQLGVQCFNIGTVYSIYRALALAEPLISRIVTLTGAVAQPQNVEALIGTPASELMHYAGQQSNSHSVIVGGPLMGYTLPDTQSGINAACNCLIAHSDSLFPARPASLPCIRCGDCARACPVQLQPMDLYWFSQGQQFNKARDWHLYDCIECGACSYVCPSHIPLVDYFQYAKGELWASERAKAASDQARQRHEFRQLRLVREKQEKAARLAAKAVALKSASTNMPSPPPDDADKKAAIAAAMARAAAKQASTPAPSANTQAAQDEAKQAAIAAAMARAAARKTQADLPESPKE